MNNKILFVVGAVVIAAAAFFAGTKYQESQARTQFAAGNFRGQGQGAMMGQRRAGSGNFGNAVRGEVISSDNKSITVKLPDGSSKVIILSDTTSYMKADKAAQSDITAGSTVMVFGTTNSDGSITAQSVQLNPQQLRLNGNGEGSGGNQSNQ